MSKNLDRAEKSLEWEPETLNIDIEQIKRDARDGVNRLVEFEIISQEEADAMYEEWFSTYQPTTSD